MFSTIRTSLRHAQSDRIERRATLLPVSNDENAPSPLEKPTRGRPLREMPMNFQFSRQDSPPILVSERSINGRNKREPSTSRLDTEYTRKPFPEYPEITRSQQEDLQRYFDKKKQLCNLLGKGLLRWLVTCFLIGMMYYSLMHFSAKKVMGSVWEYLQSCYIAEGVSGDGKKRFFISIMTALSLALGFNMAACFKTMAIDTRWWILSRKRRPLPEVYFVYHIQF